MIIGLTIGVVGFFFLSKVAILILFLCVKSVYVRKKRKRERVKKAKLYIQKKGSFLISINLFLDSLIIRFLL
jgi:hypothetical protein